jgi:DNA-binding CsgD family transcriptional regulator
MARFTPTEKRMLRVLSDGLPHSRDELQLCLWDNLGAVSNIRCHLTSIRRKLRPRGEDVLCVIHRSRPAYRHVKLICTNLNR